MVVALKQKLIGLLTRLNSKRWSGRDSIKVLIQLNKYFTRRLWQSVFEATNLFNNRDVEIIYANSKITFINLFNDADICFSFGLSRHIPKDNTKSKLLYIATAGNETIDRMDYPGNFVFVNSAGISSRAIAEYVLSMALLLNRNLHSAIRNQSFRRWKQTGTIDHSFKSISENHIAILGFGRNGRSIAKIFINVGCKVSVCDTDRNKRDDSVDFYPPGEIDMFLSLADILVLAVPLNETTRGLLDQERLLKLKHGCVIINVSRGAVIDENALLNAVRSGRIKGAALDVFKKEPLPVTSKLWSTKNIIITPHISGNINILRKEIMEDFIKQLKSRL